MAKTRPFDQHAEQYEQWFDDNIHVYKSEINAVRKLIPAEGRGIEVGIGSGKFAIPLNIKEGIDPSLEMRNKARAKGLNVINGIAEQLPYNNESIDYILMVTTICFLDDPHKSFSEAKRVLKNNGYLIIGFVDKTSPLGRKYAVNKAKSVFYKDTVFYSTRDIYALYEQNGFIIDQTVQTVFGPLSQVNMVQQPKQGHEQGSFVVVRGIKRV